MDAAHGLVLMIYSFATFVMIRLVAFGGANFDWDKLVSLPDVPRRRFATIVAVVLTLALWGFENRARKQWSPEAEARDYLEAVVQTWESGDTRRAVAMIQGLAFQERPWDVEPVGDSD